MTHDQILIQVIATFVMAVSSIAMFVVTTYIAKNAKIMRQINTTGNKISLWVHRYEVYRDLLNWHEKVKRMFELMGTRESLINSTLNISNADVESAINTMRKGSLLFAENEQLVQFFSGYVGHIYALQTPLDNLKKRNSNRHIIRQLFEYATPDKIMEVYTEITPYVSF
ncbi:MAG: hypothetical protein HQ534_09025 [Armatimonadetes bacterium]|nr:hypothetical protein [Armatimonadota bacterium]